ncbi:V-type ATP synthase subunit D [Actinoplanes sp. NPDC048967]|uniref:V-type ATP synthase subunit D n=1 Tax=Actinoplanes sp. NPDC048967 TaxID=3155269 RepID=UPI0033CD6666
MAELRVPPGRAGRLWLGDRLATARRAATLLDHKLHVLRTERERLVLTADRTRTRWIAVQREADLWLTRAAVLGGQREIRFGTAEHLAEVTLTWDAVMGVRYPGEAVCALPAEPAGSRSPGTAALIEATVAHGRALRAAVEHAAATAACRIIETETRETRRRLHAIADRWIPRLESALRGLDERLEEAERSEAVQLRWAAGRTGSGGAP